MSDDEKGDPFSVSVHYSSRSLPTGDVEIRKPPIMEGFIKKKSPKSMFGRHIWQSRWFVLEPYRLLYFKKYSDASFENLAKGNIALEEISSVVVLNHSMASTRFRFNLQLTDDTTDRVFELMIDGDDFGKGNQWVVAIKKCMEEAKKGHADEGGLRTLQLLRKNTKFWKPKVAAAIDHQMRKKREGVYASNRAMPRTFTSNDLATRPKLAQGQAPLEMVLNALYHQPALKMADQSQIREMIATMYKLEYQEGEIVFNFNDRVGMCFVIDHGVFEVKWDNGRLKQCTVGECLGELQLIADNPSDCAIRAATKGAVWVLTRSSYKEIVIRGTKRVLRQNEAFLRSTELLGKLDSHSLSVVVDALEEDDFKAGEDIVVQGQEGDRFYLLKSGICEVIVDGVKVHEYTKQGDYFGERALLKNQVRAATVTALTDVTLLSLDRHSFTELLGPLQDLMDAQREALMAKQAATPRRGSNPYSLPTHPTLTSSSSFTSAPSTYASPFSPSSASSYPSHGYSSKNPPPPPASSNSRRSSAEHGETDNSLRVALGDYVEVRTNSGRQIGVVAFAGPTSFASGSWLGLRLVRRLDVGKNDGSVKGVRYFTADNNRGIFIRPEQVDGILSPQQIRELQAAPDHQPISFFTDREANNNNNNNLALGLPMSPSASYINTSSCSPPTSQFAMSPPSSPGFTSSMFRTPAKGGERSSRKSSSSVCDEEESEKRRTSYANEEDDAPGDSGVQTTLFISPSASQTSFNVKDLVVIGLLGDGAFGRVQLVLDGRDNHTYALKTITRARMREANQVSFVKNERQTMSLLKHPFIVSLLCAMCDDVCIYFLMEPVMGGELFTVLQEKDKFTVPMAQFYLASVVLAFEYMHSEGILYRDLKPENVLLDTDGYIKITDFGFAKKLVKGEERTFTFCGTPDYLCPEMVLNAGHGVGADWWCCGILLYEMLTGTTPFFDDNGTMAMYDKILIGEFTFPDHVPKDARDLIKRLLARKPTKRLGVLRGGASLIKKHPFFTGFDWQALAERRLQAPYLKPIKNQFDLSNFVAESG